MTEDTPRPTPTTQAEWHQHNGWHHHPPLATEDVDHWHGPHHVPDEALSSGEMDCRRVLEWWQDMALSQGAHAERAEARDATGLREALDEDTDRRLRDLRLAIEQMDTTITPYGERDDGTTMAYIVSDSTWHRVLAVSRGFVSDKARAALAAPPQEPRWPGLDPWQLACRLWEAGFLAHSFGNCTVAYEACPEDTCRSFRDPKHTLAALREGAERP